jgi:hypothetical protein
MNKYWSSGVVDLDIRLNAHINSGSYREKQKHNGKRIAFNT